MPIGGVADETFKRFFDEKKLISPNLKKVYFSDDEIQNKEEFDKST